LLVSDVTLLFTDIEGSTRLVQRLGEAYADELGRHRKLVRGAAAAHGGTEIDCRGDEFSIGFDDADDAIAAAAAIQEAHDEELRVRIGIHSGTPMRVDGGYVGVDVHRAARICAAGHGGQTLLSAAARAALTGVVELRDLGEHWLRGLDQPERIFQVGDAQFPALRADVEDRGLGAPIRVVLADDAVLLREGIASLLSSAGFQVVGQSGTADDLMLKVRSYDPDVAIVDIRMPPTHSDEGLRAAQEIRERHPSTGVLVLSQYVEAESAEGVGYLLKDRIANVEEFTSAVRRVSQGGSALDPTVVAQLVGRHRKDDPLSTLTPREREVLELMAEGLSNSAIAERIFVTERAVEKHVTSIFQKLRLPAAPDTHRRVLAVLAFLRA
jgi:DNA-binding NarL/FixJ family response regulator